MTRVHFIHPVSVAKRTLLPPGEGGQRPDEGRATLEPVLKCIKKVPGTERTIGTWHLCQLEKLAASPFRHLIDADRFRED